MKRYDFCVKLYDKDGLGNVEHFFKDYQEAMNFFDSMDEEENKDAYRKMTLTMIDYLTHRDTNYAVRRWN